MANFITQIKKIKSNIFWHWLVFVSMVLTLISWASRASHDFQQENWTWAVNGFIGCSLMVFLIIDRVDQIAKARLHLKMLEELWANGRYSSGNLTVTMDEDSK